ncbi:MAG: beta-lactamase family protein [Anaerolineae bacterium]|nr:beta-lactamase family protein [Anaerolineae bacterium]
MSAAPEDLGLSSERLEAALSLLRERVDSGFVPGAVVAVFRRGRLVRLAPYGYRDPETLSLPVETDTTFLIASLTKPIVVAGAVLLLQQGKLCLDQPAAHVIPEFGAQGKQGVTIRHLMTHTSGLPDQLPQSPELRRRQAPKDDFVRAVCELAPLFQPGSQVSYQSMGILILGEIIERLTGMELRDYLQQRLFLPLGMDSSVLGMPPTGLEHSALCLPLRLPPESRDVGDDFNTIYWRDFGAPWGGLHSTAADLSRFLGHVLGDLPGPLSPAARRAMVRDQLAGMPGVRSEEGLSRRWGLGFMLGAAYFGDLVSPDTFGHVGSTGTMYWADPDSRLGCVLLTNQPQLLRDESGRSEHFLPRFSNALAAAIERW